MNIKKRNNTLVKFNPNKITARIRKVANGLKVDTDKIAVKVISQIKDGITTKELDNLAVEVCMANTVNHPDYSKLASKLRITMLYKELPSTFSECVNRINSDLGLLNNKFVNYVNANSEKLNSLINNHRDFNYDIFGLKTLERSYLIKDTKSNFLYESPQYMWMRVAIEVSKYNMEQIEVTYNLLSEGYYTHATPTLFNSGTNRTQLASCFLLGMKDDSIKGIYDTLSDCASISKWAGGIGIHAHNIRSSGSQIKGTNGVSNGLVPMLKVFNETARYVDQGGGKRKGSFAIYLEPHHPDIFDFLDLKKNHGKEEMRARDLFYAMWIPDLFMKKVQNNEDWYLIDPNVVYNKYGKYLSDVYGQDFETMYNELINDELYVKKISAHSLWEKIIVSQIETGTPYIGYKDKVNKHNNQKNYGTIRSSNLCIEINEYSDDKEQAVCNLASIALPKFIKNKVFDYNELQKVVKHVVRKLDNVIDVNYYPTEETKTSNMRHRPIGLGVQGLADVFMKMKIPFDSDEAKQVNKLIFENMYFAAVESSTELAKERGVYESFNGSPSSSGVLQFDLWGDAKLSENLDWKGLKEKVCVNGLRNSLLIALMPTASTSQILGNNECFEPITSNLYVRRTLSGEFILLNKYLVKDLENIGLWNSDMKNQLMINNGSIQNITSIPDNMKSLYKTAYEISMKDVIDMAADRQRFICQAQSMNLFVPNMTLSKLTSMHFYGWSKGLKTGSYYIRGKSAVDAIKFTVEKNDSESMTKEEYKKMIEKNRDLDDCDMCGA